MRNVDVAGDLVESRMLRGVRARNSLYVVRGRWKLESKKMVGRNLEGRRWKG